MDPVAVSEKVREHYSEAAHSDNPKYSETVAKSFGYTQEDLAATGESNLGLSCGSPVALASLRVGETVVDLGCGAGFDVFLASTKVGPAGHVFGIDTNEDMLARASKIQAARGVNNVTFSRADITALPLPDATADCVISNCVINLVPGADAKAAVFREAHRVLRPGGRLAVSDILAKQPLPPALAADVALYVGCVAGASLVEEYVKYLEDAGFRTFDLTDTHVDLNVYWDTASDGQKKAGCCETSCCTGGDCTGRACGGQRCGGGAATEDSPAQLKAEGNGRPADLNDYVASYRIYAVKDDKRNDA